MVAEQRSRHDPYMLFLLSESILVLKGRDITLLTMVHIVKPMVFPVDMYGCESSWAEC